MEEGDRRGEAGEVGDVRVCSRGNGGNFEKGLVWRWWMERGCI